jgi:hypothetical protein
LPLFAFLRQAMFSELKQDYYLTENPPQTENPAEYNSAGLVHF